MAKSDPNRMIMVRPKGRLRPELERAARLHPEGKNMSEIMREAFWRWHSEQEYLKPKRRTARRS